MTKNKCRQAMAVLGLMALSFSAKAAPPSVIQGKINQENVQNVYLFTVKEGKMQEFASTKVGADNGYVLGLSSVEEGYYYVSLNKRDYTRLYLKQGDQVKMDMEAEARYQLAAPSVENKLLMEWAGKSLELRRIALMTKSDNSGYKSFFERFEQLEKEAKGIKAKATTSNKKFNELFKFTVDADLELIGLSFLYTPHSSHPTKEEYPAFFGKVFQPNKYADGKLLKLGEGEKLMGFYATWGMMNGKPINGKMARAERWKLVTDMFGNDTIKAMFVMNDMRSIKSFDELAELAAPYKSMFTEAQLEEYKKHEKSLHTFAAGEAALNFSYPDINGKTVTLKDLKGKVVLVDVWATWCGPCKQEIPSLKALEKEMHDKDVALVSISVDVEKDKQKWQDFVKKEALTGIQLFASGWSEITKFYDIKGIPRFMVFDRNGKIVTVDAPRPSNAALKPLLEKALAK
ncbi:TlpA family protein disulfide reductase [Chitinophaga horti]|uniref:TlpA family protein disulfide reductase n=1 Tax=Chitinophaga horti TaxID=2920382 RepID=A0ABY6J027_9BACT|nr:TlpA disulfide reductase family protein [Chitinophaga horti]UYQ92776.1 TlpA family protein disulfide reductase [Chitinophaga horti]